MPRCPKCTAMIDHLKEYQVSEELFDLRIVDGEPTGDQIGEMQFSHEHFDCPECNETVFRNEDDAIAFLKTKMEIPPAPKQADP